MNKSIEEMTLEELKKYREILVENISVVGTANHMNELVQIHNRMIKLKKENKQ